ncbi:MAG: hypothetical protein ACI8UR_001791, partial [Natronomonas sp.]
NYRKITVSLYRTIPSRALSDKTAGQEPDLPSILLRRLN